MALPLIFFPPPQNRPEHDGLWLRIKPAHGNPWIGNFKFGYTSAPSSFRVVSSPNANRCCVIANGAAYLDDSFDWEKGGSLRDGIFRDLLRGFDENTGQIVNSTSLLFVEDVRTDSAGGFCLILSGGFRLVVFPSGTRSEAWRFFKPSTDEFNSDAPSSPFPTESESRTS